MDSAETFFRALPNLVYWLEKQINALNTLSLKPTVRPGWDSSREKGWQYPAAWLGEKCMSYEYEWQAYEPVDITEYHELTDVFLQVKYAFTWNAEIKPRYFLGIPSKATSNEIRKGHLESYKAMGRKNDV